MPVVNPLPRVPALVRGPILGGSLPEGGRCHGLRLAVRLLAVQVELYDPANRRGETAIVLDCDGAQEIHHRLRESNVDLCFVSHTRNVA